MLVLFSNLFFVAMVASGRIKYDQSQTGDYNVHLDLKNIEIVAFLDDSSSLNNEYDYDYGEMTLKPSSNSTESNIESISLTNNSSPNTENANNTNILKSTPLHDGLQQATTSSVSLPRRRCGAGFFRDVNGRCRRLRRPNTKLDGFIQQSKKVFSRKDD